MIDAVVGAGHDVLVVQPGSGEAGEGSHFRTVAIPVRTGLGRAVTKVASASPLRSARVTAAGRRSAAAEIATFQPDLAVVSEVLSWPVATDLLPDGVPWIFDAHNVESDLFREFADNAVTVFDKVTFGIDSRRVARQEREVLARADAVLAVSEEDARELAGLAPLRRRPIVVPSSVPTPPAPGAIGTDPVLLFVGTLNFPPNVAALRELVETILPGIRQFVPDAQLFVAGRKPTPEIRAILTGTEGVALKENLPDLTPLYRRARCAVMPIRSGSGSRLKVYEALAHGLPLVATARAVEGVPLDDEVIITAESADELVAGAVRMLQDVTLAERIRTASRQVFLDKLSWEHASAPLLALIDEFG